MQKHWQKLKVGGWWRFPEATIAGMRWRLREAREQQPELRSRTFRLRAVSDGVVVRRVR